MQRFTISHHSGSKDGDHYDLMLFAYIASAIGKAASKALSGEEIDRLIDTHGLLDASHYADLVK